MPKENSYKKLASRFSSLNTSALVIAIIASLAIFGLPVMWLAGVLLAFFVLEKTTTEAFVITLAALMPSTIAVFMLGDFLAWQIILQVSMFIVMVLVLSIVLRNYSSWSLVIQTSTIFSILIVAAIYTIYPDIDNWWLEHLKSFFTESDLADNMDQLLVYAKYATGMQVLMLSISSLASLLFARLWQAGVYNKQKNFRNEVLGISMSFFSIVMMLLMILCCFLHINWALDSFIIAMIPAYVAGISVFHSWVYKYRKKSKNGFLFLVFYLANLVIFPYLPLLVVVLGVTDRFINYRKRFNFAY